MNKQHLLIGSAVVLAILTLFAWIAKPEKHNGSSNSTNWNWENNWNNGSHPVQPSAPPNQPIVPPAQPEVEKVTKEPKNYNDALKISAESNKPVLVFFTAPWCHYCTQMKQETLPKPEVQAALKKYVFVTVNKDLNRALGNKFGVTGIPAYVVVNSKEEKLRSTDGYMPPAQFVAWLSGS